MDEIRCALEQSDPDDFPAIRQYIQWVRVRRIVTDIFYFRAHWIKPVEFKAHWAGRRM